MKLYKLFIFSLIFLSFSLHASFIDDLCCALQQGDADRVEELLADDGYCDVNATDCSGWPPLFHAIMKGSSELVQKLIDKGANPNRSYDIQLSLESDRTTYVTALHYAVWLQREEIVKDLLSYPGANGKITDSYGHDALWYARQTGNAQMVQALEDAVAQMVQSEQAACTAGSAAAAAISAPSDEISLLHYTSLQQEVANIIEAGNVRALRRLLEDPVYVSYAIFEEIDDSPIGKKVVVDLKLTLFSGCMPSILVSRMPFFEHSDQVTWLHYAAFCGKAGIVRLLLEHGANPNARDGQEIPGRPGCYYSTDGRTPLHYACAGGHDEVVELLAQHGADWDCADGGGVTPKQLWSERCQAKCRVNSRVSQAS